MTDFNAPPPWNLTGSGYVLVFRFPRAFVMDHGFVPDDLRDQFVGGFGTVMLVDYYTSGVGPYREALFIPGRFSLHGRREYMITKIYVSTMASVDGGRANWGIPKEAADFDVTDAEGITHFAMSVAGKRVLDVSLRPRRLALSINTRLNPWPLGVMQTLDGRVYLTRPHAKGRVSPARVINASANPEYFPDFSPFRPLFAVHARRFDMVFPVPLMLQGAPAYESAG
jgi:hypothetical protein